jgi:hypothetical protein
VKKIIPSIICELLIHDPHDIKDEDSSSTKRIVFQTNLEMMDEIISYLSKFRTDLLKEKDTIVIKDNS